MRFVPSSIVSYLSKTYPWLPNEQAPPNSKSPGSVKGLVVMFDRVPDELLRLTPSDATRLIVAIERLRVGLDIKTPSSDFTSEESKSLRDVFNLLGQCPYDVPASGTTELSFIDDADLRNTLLLDLSEINQSVQNREWKSATVLAGSAAEALLLWALEAKIDKPIEIGREVSIKKKRRAKLGLHDL